MGRKFLAILLSVMMISISITPTFTAASDTSLTNDIVRYNVLVLDTSGGVSFQDSANDIIIYTADTAISYVRQAANRFVSDLINAGGTNYVAIVTYDSTSKIVSDFSTNITVIREKINYLSSGTEGGINLAAGLQQANSLLNSVNNDGAILNVILFTTGCTITGDYNYSGHYNENTVGSRWWTPANDGNNVKLYAFANVAYDAAESIKRKATLYSIGLFQKLNNIPDEGKDILAFFKLTALDLATSIEKFYEVDDPNDLEFIFFEVSSSIVRRTGKFKYPGDGYDYSSTYYYDDAYFYVSGK